ncbi:MAG: DUF1576 domain-containing protein [Clostridia bacterium]|nr:DUF1576 domain-containing protein [Clostridia bacterium]
MDNPTMQRMTSRRDDRMMSRFMLFLSLYFLFCSLCAVFILEEGNFLSSLGRLLVSPSRLVTDYFALSGVAVTFFNVGVCGLIANAVIGLSRLPINATAFAAYLLVVAHGFYGLNFLNLWLPMLGVLLYCLVRRARVSENAHIMLFATALAPFVSDLLFAYPLPDRDGFGFSVIGLVLSVLLSVFSGFFAPAVLPGTTAMHRGYNMYKAGLALGLLGLFLYSFLYPSLGISEPLPSVTAGMPKPTLLSAQGIFAEVSLFVLFLISLLLGFFFNGKSFRGYRSLLRASGYGTDFYHLHGVPLCFVNFGVYGFALLAYLNAVFALPLLIPGLPAAACFTGPTVGVVFAALSFSADGQNVRNIAPIAVGYFSLFLVCSLGCVALSRPVAWTLGTQSYVNGFAFATGLCPFAGKYGKRFGTLAGFLGATICTVTDEMHGGFVLYNGGFTAGLTALILICLLDFYHIKPKFRDDTTENAAP